MAKEYKLKGVTSLDLSPGDKQEVEVEGIQDGKVLLVNAGGTIQATGAKCTHYGAPLVKGVLTKSGRLTCPWHGACFNAKTGDIEDAPALDGIPIFGVAQRDGAVYVTGEESAIKSSRRKPNYKCASAASDAQKDHVVIVGGGSGALGAIEGLRENGFQGAVTVVSNEGYLPIDRPRLSKGLATDEKKLAWRDDDFYKGAAVEWVDGEVTSVDFSGRSVSTKNGQDISYTKLVLATGGTPRRLPLPGVAELDNIHTLRTVHDTKKIVASIGDKDAGRRVVIIGSSFIGMEVANATAGKNPVTVIGMEKAPLERVLGEQVGAGIQKAMENKGVKFYMGAGVERVEPSGSDPHKVGAVHLKDGTEIAADVLILGVGVAPATEYLKDNQAVSLERDGSLKTDENYSVTNLDGVYAVGDIATFPYHGPGGNGSHVRIEHWNVAQQSGRVAARHIVDSSTTAEHFIPVFWSALGAQLRYCGNSSLGWDDLVLQGDAAEAKFVAYYCKGDTVVAMASMGRDPAMTQSAELMRRGKMPGKKELDGGLDVLSLGVPE